MGRTILADNSLQKRIESFTDVHIGVVIGQVTGQKDYAVHLVQTPQQDEQEDSPSKKKSVFNIDSVDEIWVATHAQQVKRMLPGGLDIVGVYATGPPDALKNAQYKLRQALYAIYKAVCKKCVFTCDSQPTDRFTLMICTVTKKITCRTFDVADHKSSAKPADWKYQNVSERWLQLDTRLALDIVLPISHETTSQILEKQLLSGLQPTFDNIWNSLATVDNQLLPDSQALDTSSQSSAARGGGGKKGKKHKQQASAEEEPAPKYTVDLFHQVQRGCKGPLTAQMSACDAKVWIRGLVCGRAYMYSHATVKEALQALKCDVVASLVARCELLCEDLLQAEEEHDPKVLYETPVRVFAPLRDTGLCLCDYTFVDEESKDSAERFNDLVDLDITEEDIHMDWERVPVEEDLEKPQHLPRTAQSSSDTENTGPEPSKHTFSSGLGMVLGAIAAGAAAISAYFYLGDD